MKIKVTMLDAGEDKATKTFDNIPEATADSRLKQLANKYLVFTNAASTTAEKIVSTVIDLD